MTAHDTYSGVFPAMVTPFNDDGSIDFDSLSADAQRLERAGVDGLVPVGSTGESATMTHDEHVQVVETVSGAVENVPVIAGSGSNNTAEALELSERSAEAGADGLLLISPYYNRPEPEGMEHHYRTIADAVDLPQVIYNVPGRTGRNIAVETAASLADHENVVGYKAASGDLARISEVVERTREADFSVLSGDDAMTLPTLSVGGTGTISVVANVEPERTCAMVGAALAGDYERARSLHHELGGLMRTLFAESNPIPVKEAMAMRGHCEPYLRSPLSPASEGVREELEELLSDLESSSAVELEA
ncbi:4-hydroxy-tetrahydrodipicolinate synthase [Halalkalicoccus subterraneus]|uniref:4-hydroxy-tetrahydrodipicolinate synthase n=1 Tax=Halalkalicoccus subterraneus TaxID=2675002 RepID=UPI000EFBACF6|nr:4-hydroxy-tetrahydrodipicolinate synthase [Halalkalicoccus subterraneus]